MVHHTLVILHAMQISSIFNKTDASIKHLSFTCNSVTFIATIGFEKIYNTYNNIYPISIYTIDRIVPATDGESIIVPIFTWYNYSSNTSIYLCLFQTELHKTVMNNFTAHVYYIK